MSTIPAPSPGTQPDRKGLLAAVTGVSVALGALGLSTACCWAPAVILSLGLGSAFAAFLGAQWYIVAAGAVLAVGGLAWHVRRRDQDACGCATPDGEGRS